MAAAKRTNQRRDQQQLTNEDAPPENEKIACRLSSIAGSNFAERLSSVFILVCLPVVAYWVILNTAPSEPFSEIAGIFQAMTPGTFNWNYHPIGWACKGLGLGALGRFLLSPFVRWLYTGHI